MRVVRIEVGEVTGEQAPQQSAEQLVALHAQLTVVRGLTGPARSRFVDAVGRIDADRLDDGGGELEASGVLLPLDAASLELLGLDASHDAVISPQHLGVAGPMPGAGAGNALPGSSATTGAVDAPIADDDPVARWFTDEGDESIEPAAVPLGPGPGLQPADAPTPAQPVRHPPLVRRIAALRSRRSELSHLVEGISPIDLHEVRAALTSLETAPDSVPLAGSTELADAWADLQKDLKGLDIGTTREERVAMAALARAREAVAEAEAILRQPQLTEEQIRRIEAAHVGYIEASDKVERRFGGGRGRKQLAEAEAEELRLLTRFGFESWVDYMLSTTKRAADPDMAKERADLEAAQLELEVCVGELDAIPGAVGRRRRRVRLHERQEELSDRVAAVLGHEPVGDGVEAELRGLTALSDRTAQTAALARVLEAAGVEVAAYKRDIDRLTEAARHALATEARSEKRRSELTVAVDAIDEALGVLDLALEEGATEVPELPDLPDMAEPPVGLLDFLDDEPAAVEQLEMDIGIEPVQPPDVDDADGGAGEGSAGADDEVDRATADADVAGIEKLFDPDALYQGRSSGEVLAADGADAGHEPHGTHEPRAAQAVHVANGVQPATTGADGSPGRYVPRDLSDRAGLIDDIHWEAMQLIAGVQVDGPAGQLPVVFDDPFGLLDAGECIEVLSRLARLSDHVQMIVVTDRPEVSEWASAIGSDHAAVVGIAS